MRRMNFWQGQIIEKRLLDCKKETLQFEYMTHILAKTIPKPPVMIKRISSLCRFFMQEPKL